MNLNCDELLNYYQDWYTDKSAFYCSPGVLMTGVHDQSMWCFARKPVGFWHGGGQGENGECIGEAIAPRSVFQRTSITPRRRTKYLKLPECILDKEKT